jgi:hypothetical protein
MTPGSGFQLSPPGDTAGEQDQVDARFFVFDAEDLTVER